MYNRLSPPHAYCSSHHRLCTTNNAWRTKSSALALQRPQDVSNAPTRSLLNMRHLFGPRGKRDLFPSWICLKFLRPIRKRTCRMACTMLQRDTRPCIRPLSKRFRLKCPSYMLHLVLLPEASTTRRPSVLDCPVGGPIMTRFPRIRQNRNNVERQC